MTMQPNLTSESSTSELKITACPECGDYAEVEWSCSMAGTNGLVEHAKIRCLSRHWFFMPTDQLQPMS